ncbi:MAG: hypothetical protein COA36_06410 [Desulfotalea sp.]|nr:MAG: hypothetical protein COA36_06410 [Desulfotalea sp.]
MFDFVKNILGNKEQKVSKSSPGSDGHIALCVLLLEAAYVDGECSASELEHLQKTLTSTFAIKALDIEDLLAKSRDKREESIDIFHFTRHLNQNFSKEEKVKLMESVWSIILIDDHLESHEDHFAHKLANLLRLSHKELIDAKLAARKQLAK